MSAVIVVAEENGSGDEISRAHCRVMRAQNLNSWLIAFRPVGCASAVAVLGNHDWLAGKCGVNLIQITACIHRGPRRPRSVVFVGLDKIHQPRNIALRGTAERVRSVGAE